jgi:hypothetical protein
MRRWLLFMTLGMVVAAQAQIKTSRYFISAGINYRDYPVDIENAPRGPLPRSEDGFYGSAFWQTASLQAGAGKNLGKNWQVSLTGHIRYNHFHWLELPWEGLVSSQDLKEKKSFKYDLLLECEKGFLLKQKKGKYIIASFGLGAVNMNTRYDITLRGVTPSGAMYEQDFNGTFLRLSPKISVGYQYKKVKVTIDAMVVEGAQLANYTALWPGITLRYEFPALLKKQ